jgi:hypothetical protein
MYSSPRLRTLQASKGDGGCLRLEVGLEKTGRKPPHAAQHTVRVRINPSSTWRDEPSIELCERRPVPLPLDGTWVTLEEEPPCRALVLDDVSTPRELDDLGNPQLMKS